MNDNLGCLVPGGEEAYVSHAWHRLVSSLSESFEKLETQFHEAYWDSQIDATPASDRKRAELELELRRVKGDAQSLAQVNEALEEEIHEPLLLRQLEVLRLSLTGNQMGDEQRAALVELSTSVESDFASYRPLLDGKPLSENDVERVLAASDDQDLRRRTWAASKEIGGRVAGRVRELARLRNDVARDLGFGDYYSFALALQEMDEEWLFELLADLEEMTDEPFRRWKAGLDDSLRMEFGTDELYPWHYGDPFFQSLPSHDRVDVCDLIQDGDAVELAERTFKAWDIDLSEVMQRSDLYPRDRKCQHAFCLHVDRADDVRILGNVVPGERWIEVMLHESGHASYDISIDRGLPYLLRRAAHTFVTEGVAILAGRLVRDTEWLTTIARADPGRVAAVKDQLVAGTAAQSLLFMRWGLVVVHFERALYGDPEGDLDTLWWDLVERFQLLNRPPERHAPDWASKIHVAVAPVYYQNYLLGEMLASQLERTCRQETGGLVGRAEVGDMLQESVFRHGSSRRWDTLVEQATGGPLGAADFAAAVTT